MVKILITGATGFIGNHVIQYLLKNHAEDCDVIATSANAEKAKTYDWYPQVKYINFNFSKFDSTINYFDFFGRPQKMIHLAWEGLPNYKALFHFEKNLPAHYSFIKNLVFNGLTDITIAGTCFEYGLQEGCLREDLPAIPANAYALSKDTLRKFLQELQNQNPFILKWVRLFYMYGEGQSPNSLFSQLDTALENHEEVFNMSGGEQVRDYLPVEKVAEYIVKIALQQQVTGIINCGSGDPVRLKIFVEKYLNDRKKSIKLNTGFYPYNDFEPMKFWADITKLKKIINNE